MSTSFLLLFQVSTWAVAPTGATVGDTVFLTREITATPDVRARLQPLERSAVLEPLASPRWSFTEGSLTVVYAVALFEPGRQVIALPAIELIYADGRAVTVTGDSAWVDIVSVLPAADTTLQPKPSQGPIGRARRDPLPAMLLVLGALSVLAAWGMLRRRRRGPRPTIESDIVVASPPLDLWVAAGESRAVATATADRLREQLALRIPHAERYLHTEECIAVLLQGDLGTTGTQLATVLRALERARFSPAAPGDVLEVVDEAERLITVLRTGELAEA